MRADADSQAVASTEEITVHSCLPARDDNEMHIFGGIQFLALPPSMSCHPLVVQSSLGSSYLPRRSGIIQKNFLLLEAILLLGSIHAVSVAFKVHIHLSQNINIY